MSNESRYPNPSAEGKIIDLKEANQMIHQFIDLRNKTIRTPNEGVIPEQEPTDSAAKTEIVRVQNFCVEDGKYNAFVFSKDLIMRFFNGEENDKAGNPRSANFLMVILGAHTESKDNFVAGSPTVLTVGCTRKKVKIDGKSTYQFFPLGIMKEANEYPPKTIVSKLSEDQTEKEKLLFDKLDIDDFNQTDRSIYFEEVIKE